MCNGNGTSSYQKCAEDPDCVAVMTLGVRDGGGYVIDAGQVNSSLMPWFLSKVQGLFTNSLRGPFGKGSLQKFV